MIEKRFKLYPIKLTAAILLPAVFSTSTLAQNDAANIHVPIREFREQVSHLKLPSASLRFKRYLGLQMTSLMPETFARNELRSDANREGLLPQEFLSSHPQDQVKWQEFLRVQFSKFADEWSKQPPALKELFPEETRILEILNNNQLSANDVNIETFFKLNALQSASIDFMPHTRQKTQLPEGAEEMTLPGHSGSILNGWALRARASAADRNPAFVLLPPWGQDASSLISIAEVLHREFPAFHVIALNYHRETNEAPVHNTGGIVESYDIESAIRALPTAVADYKIDPSQIIGIGYSMGANMLALAQERTSLLSHLITIGLHDAYDQVLLKYYTDSYIPLMTRLLARKKYDFVDWSKPDVLGHAKKLLIDARLKMNQFVIRERNLPIDPEGNTFSKPSDVLPKFQIPVFLAFEEDSELLGDPVRTFYRDLTDRMTASGKAAQFKTYPGKHNEINPEALVSGIKTFLAATRSEMRSNPNGFDTPPKTGGSASTNHYFKPALNQEVETVLTTDLSKSVDSMKVRAELRKESENPNTVFDAEFDGSRDEVLRFLGIKIDLPYGILAYEKQRVKYNEPSIFLNVTTYRHQLQLESGERIVFYTKERAISNFWHFQNLKPKHFLSPVALLTWLVRSALNFSNSINLHNESKLLRQAHLAGLSPKVMIMRVRGKETLFQLTAEGRSMSQIEQINARMVSTAARALGILHGLGIVHRDLAPLNSEDVLNREVVLDHIFVSDNPSLPRVQFIDFEYARFSGFFTRLLERTDFIARIRGHFPELSLSRENLIRSYSAGLQSSQENSIVLLMHLILSPGTWFRELTAMFLLAVTFLARKLSRSQHQPQVFRVSAITKTPRSELRQRGEDVGTVSANGQIAELRRRASEVIEELKRIDSRPVRQLSVEQNNLTQKAARVQIEIKQLLEPLIEKPVNKRTSEDQNTILKMKDLMTQIERGMTILLVSEPPVQSIEWLFKGRSGSVFFPLSRRFLKIIALSLSALFFSVSFLYFYNVVPFLSETQNVRFYHEVLYQFTVYGVFMLALLIPGIFYRLARPDTSYVRIKNLTDINLPLEIRRIAFLDESKRPVVVFVEHKPDFNHFFSYIQENKKLIDRFQDVEVQYLSRTKRMFWKLLTARPWKAALYWLVPAPFLIFTNYFFYALPVPPDDYWGKVSVYSFFLKNLEVLSGEFDFLVNLPSLIASPRPLSALKGYFFQIVTYGTAPLTLLSMMVFPGILSLVHLRAQQRALQAKAENARSIFHSRALWFTLLAAGYFLYQGYLVFGWLAAGFAIIKISIHQLVQSSEMPAHSRQRRISAFLSRLVLIGVLIFPSFWLKEMKRALLAGDIGMAALRIPSVMSNKDMSAYILNVIRHSASRNNPVLRERATEFFLRHYRSIKLSSPSEARIVVWNYLYVIDFERVFLLEPEARKLILELLAPTWNWRRFANNTLLNADGNPVKTQQAKRQLSLNLNRMQFFLDQIENDWEGKGKQLFLLLEGYALRTELNPLAVFRKFFGNEITEPELIQKIKSAGEHLKHLQRRLQEDMPRSELRSEPDGSDTPPKTGGFELRTKPDQAPQRALISREMFDQFLKMNPNPTVRDVMNQFNVSKTTARDTLRRFKKIYQRKRSTAPVIGVLLNQETLQAFVDANPEVNLEAIAKHFSASRRTVRRVLDEFEISYQRKYAPGRPKKPKSKRKQKVETPRKSFMPFSLAQRLEGIVFDESAVREEWLEGVRTGNQEAFNKLVTVLVPLIRDIAKEIVMGRARNVRAPSANEIERYEELVDEGVIELYSAILEFANHSRDHVNFVQFVKLKIENHLRQVSGSGARAYRNERTNSDAVFSVVPSPHDDARQSDQIASDSEAGVMSIDPEWSPLSLNALFDPVIPRARRQVKPVRFVTDRSELRRDPLLENNELIPPFDARTKRREWLWADGVIEQALSKSGVLIVQGRRIARYGVNQRRPAGQKFNPQFSFAKVTTYRRNNHPLIRRIRHRTTGKLLVTKKFPEIFEIQNDGKWRFLGTYRPQQKQKPGNKDKSIVVRTHFSELGNLQVFGKSILKITEYKDLPAYIFYTQGVPTKVLVVSEKMNPISEGRFQISERVIDELGASLVFALDQKHEWVLKESYWHVFHKDPFKTLRTFKIRKKLEKNGTIILHGKYLTRLAKYGNHWIEVIVINGIPNRVDVFDIYKQHHRIDSVPFSHVYSIRNKELKWQYSFAARLSKNNFNEMRQALIKTFLDGTGHLSLGGRSTARLSKQTMEKTKLLPGAPVDVLVEEGKITSVFIYDPVKPDHLLYVIRFNRVFDATTGKLIDTFDAPFILKGTRLKRYGRAVDIYGYRSSTSRGIRRRTFKFGRNGAFHASVSSDGKVIEVRPAETEDKLFEKYVGILKKRKSANDVQPQKSWSDSSFDFRRDVRPLLQKGDKIVIVDPKNGDDGHAVLIVTTITKEMIGFTDEGTTEEVVYSAKRFGEILNGFKIKVREAYIPSQYGTRAELRISWAEKTTNPKRRIAQARKIEQLLNRAGTEQKTNRSELRSEPDVSGTPPRTRRSELRQRIMAINDAGVFPDSGRRGLQREPLQTLRRQSTWGAFVHSFLRFMVNPTTMAMTELEYMTSLPVSGIDVKKLLAYADAYVIEKMLSIILWTKSLFSSSRKRFGNFDMSKILSNIYILVNILLYKNVILAVVNNYSELGIDHLIPTGPAGRPTVENLRSELRASQADLLTEKIPLAAERSVIALIEAGVNRNELDPAGLKSTNPKAATIKRVIEDVMEDIRLELQVSSDKRTMADLAERVLVEAKKLWNDPIQLVKLLKARLEVLNRGLIAAETLSPQIQKLIEEINPDTRKQSELRSQAGNFDISLTPDEAEILNQLREFSGILIKSEKERGQNGQDYEAMGALYLTSLRAAISQEELLQYYAVLKKVYGSEKKINVNDGFIAFLMSFALPKPKASIDPIDAVLISAAGQMDRFVSRRQLFQLAGLLLGQSAVNHPAVQAISRLANGTLAAPHDEALSSVNYGLYMFFHNEFDQLTSDIGERIIFSQPEPGRITAYHFFFFNVALKTAQLPDQYWDVDELISSQIVRNHQPLLIAMWNAAVHEAKRLWPKEEELSNQYREASKQAFAAAHEKAVAHGLGPNDFTYLDGSFEHRFGTQVPYRHNGSVVTQPAYSEHALQNHIFEKMLRDEAKNPTGGFMKPLLDHIRSLKPGLIKAAKAASRMNPEEVSELSRTLINAEYDDGVMKRAREIVNGDAELQDEDSDPEIQSLKKEKENLFSIRGRLVRIERALNRPELPYVSDSDKAFYRSWGSVKQLDAKLNEVNEKLKQARVDFIDSWTAGADQIETAIDEIVALGSRSELRRETQGTFLWTKNKIRQAIRWLERNGVPLNSGSVILDKDRRIPPLLEILFRLSVTGNALYLAAKRKSRFGSWKKALRDLKIKLPVKRQGAPWTKRLLKKGIRTLARHGVPLNYRSIHTDVSHRTRTILQDSLGFAATGAALHEMAIKKFDGWDSALKAAGIDPSTVKRSEYWWTKARVVRAIQALRDHQVDLNYQNIAQTSADRVAKILKRVFRKKRTGEQLYLAGKYQFGSWRKALEVSGINPNQVIKRTVGPRVHLRIASLKHQTEVMDREDPMFVTLIGRPVATPIQVSARRETDNELRRALTAALRRLPSSDREIGIKVLRRIQFHDKKPPFSEQDEADARRILKAFRRDYTLLGRLEQIKIDRVASKSELRLQVKHASPAGERSTLSTDKNDPTWNLDAFDALDVKERGELLRAIDTIKQTSNHQGQVWGRSGTVPGQSPTRVVTRETELFLPEFSNHLGYAFRDIINAIGGRRETIVYVDSPVVRRAILELIDDIPGSERVQFVSSDDQAGELLNGLNVTHVRLTGYGDESQDRRAQNLAETLRKQYKITDIKSRSVTSPHQIIGSVSAHLTQLALLWQNALIAAKAA